MEAYFLVDESDILERVDEYTLYCHYLEFEPEIRTNYHSPLRDDDETASFGVYPCRMPNRELAWKDSGGTSEGGDIFKLVQRMYGYKHKFEAVARVKSDFGLGEKVPDKEKIIHHVMRNRDQADIRVMPKSWTATHLDWWKRFGVHPAELDKYRVSPLFCYWSNPSQKVPAFAKVNSYVYRVYDRYQLYFPDRPKGKKFRMDLRAEHMLGMQQLKKSGDLLIITKSMKDVMCLDALGYSAIAPRSETTPPPEQLFNWVTETVSGRKRWMKVLVLFDNDGKHRADWYPYPQIEVPLSSGSKDISDFTRDHGEHEASLLMQQLVQSVRG